MCVFRGREGACKNALWLGQRCEGQGVALCCGSYTIIAGSHVNVRSRDKEQMLPWCERYGASAHDEHEQGSRRRGRMAIAFSGGS